MKTEVVLRAFASRHPEREALVCEGARVTYAALERRTNRIAHALAEEGIAPGDRVALLAANGIPWIELLLGIVKRGALIVPVSPRLTVREVAFILRDSAAGALVYGGPEREVAERAAEGLALRAWRDDAFLERAERASDVPPPVPAPLPDDCMILYTSGTEGTPKGAITTHANFLLVAHANNFDYKLGAEDRILVTTPLAHRTALARVWNALTLGATLVLMPRFDAAATLATIVRERITVAGLVPTVARMLLEALDDDAARYATLRTMISVGEAFPVELKRRLFARMPQVALYSALGMTETFGMAVLASEDQVAHAGAAGRPLPGVEVRLLDDDGNEVAPGEAGEIVVRTGEPGQSMTMRGYYNRPDETAAVLRDGWLFTGDVGRFDADGFLYVVDRKKDMIVTGGLNVYSKEVEDALRAHPAVADAAVVAMPDAAFGEAVAAFVELRDGAAPSEAELVAHCRTTIASYKKPKRIVFGALPRNAQGKVLKRELRARAAAEAAAR